MASQISVIIPAYNQAQFLPDAINSVLAQSLPAKEIIVVNDGSTDQTAQVMERYQQYIVPVHQNNQGLSGARNAGLVHASGEFIAFLDSDDMWHPDFLATMLHTLTTHPDHDLAVCHTATMEENGAIGRVSPILDTYQKDLGMDFFGTILKINPMPVHSVFLRKQCLNSADGFDTGLSALEDWDFWARIAARGHKICFTDETLAFYRRHNQAMTRDNQRMANNLDQLLEKWNHDPVIRDRLSHDDGAIAVFHQLRKARYLSESERNAAVPKLLGRINQLEEILVKHPTAALFYLQEVRNCRGEWGRAFRIAAKAQIPQTQKRQFAWRVYHRAIEERAWLVAGQAAIAAIRFDPKYLVRRLAGGRRSVAPEKTG